MRRQSSSDAGSSGGGEAMMRSKLPFGPAERTAAVVSLASSREGHAESTGTLG